MGNLRLGLGFETNPHQRVLWLRRVPPPPPSRASVSLQYVSRGDFADPEAWWVLGGERPGRYPEPLGRGLPTPAATFATWAEARGSERESPGRYSIAPDGPSPRAPEVRAGRAGSGRR